MKTELQSRNTDASYGRKIYQLNEYADTITKSNKLRKYLIQQYNLFVKKLLDEKRITVDELKPFFHKKDEVVRIIKTEEAVAKLSTKKIGITGMFPRTMNEMINEKTKDQECQHDAFNKHLVDSGQCETIEEAQKIPRHLVCRCKKCSVRF